jgi:hypothetical protein
MNEQLELGELADRLWQRAQSIAGKNEHPELGKLLIVSGSVLSWLPERMSVWRRESWKIVSGSVLNLRSGNSKSRVPNFRACSMREGFSSLRAAAGWLFFRVARSDRVARPFKRPFKRPLWHTVVQDFAACSRKAKFRFQ